MTVDTTKMIQILTTIEQLGGITSAAEHLFVSQPYLSRTIKEAESALGLTLIDRSSKPTRLTYAGHVYLNGLQQIQRQTDHLNATMQTIAQSKAGDISIALSESMSRVILPELASRFHAQYADYRLNIKELPSTQALQAVIDNQIDVYIGPKPKHLDHFLYRAMADMTFAVYGQHLEKLPDTINSAVQLRQLSLSPTIRLSLDMVAGTLVDEWLKSGHMNDMPTYTIKNVFTALSLVTNGNEIAILPRLPAQLVPETVQVLPIAPQTLSTPLILAHRSSKSNTQEMVAFLKIAQALFGVDPDTQQILSDD